MGTLLLKDSVSEEKIGSLKLNMLHCLASLVISRQSMIFNPMFYTCFVFFVHVTIGSFKEWTFVQLFLNQRVCFLCLFVRTTVVWKLQTMVIFSTSVRCNLLPVCCTPAWFCLDGWQLRGLDWEVLKVVVQCSLPTRFLCHFFFFMKISLAFPCLHFILILSGFDRWGLLWL